MVARLRYLLGVTGIGLAMTFGVATMVPVAAQETPDVPAVEEDDGGFDDWGLFGLLGLAGLLGLRKHDGHGTHVVERVGQPRH